MGVLVVATLAYGWAFLNFDPAYSVPGPEFPLLSSLHDVALHGLGAGQFPLWNPFWRTGIPYAADPDNFLLNPNAGLPVLLLGLANGAKVGVLFTFLISGLGGWLLGAALRFRPAVRIWLGIMTMASGRLAAIVMNGDYQMAASATWVAPLLALLVLALRTHRGRFIVLAAFAWAFTASTWGPYYFLYMLPCFGVIAAGTLFDYYPESGLSFNRSSLRALTLILLFTLGIGMIRLLPEVELFPLMTKGGNTYDPELTCTQSVPWTLANLVIPDRDFFDRAIPEQRGLMVEYYAYIGLVPLAALTFLIPAFRPGRRRWVIVFGSILAFTILFATPRYNLLSGLYNLIPIMTRFSCPGRILFIGVVALLALAAFSAEYLLDVIATIRTRLTLKVGRASGERFAWHIGLPLNQALSTLLLLLLFAGAADVVAHNRVGELPHYPAEEQAGPAWLRRYDPSLFYVFARDSISPRALTRQGLFDVNTTLLIDTIQNSDTSAPLGQGLRAGPQYLIGALSDDSPLNAQELAQVASGDRIYKLNDALPLAFRVPRVALEEPIPGGDNVLSPTPASALPDLTALDVELEGTNRFIIRAVNSDPSEIIVLLQAYYPDWRVWVDGRPAPLERVSWYLGTPARAGEHSYVFEYYSRTFEVGAAVTLLTLAAMVIYLMRGRERGVLHGYI